MSSVVSRFANSFAPDLWSRSKFSILIGLFTFACFMLGELPTLFLLILIGILSAREMLRAMLRTYKNHGIGDKLIKSSVICVSSLIGYAYSIVYLKDSSLFVEIIAILTITIWATDSGAYFAGKSLSKKFPAKLAPRYSPNKTWIGALGGGLAGIIAFYALWEIYIPIENNMIFVMFIAFIAIYASMAGDIMQSYCKRAAQMDDSGGLLGGHGGVWDRYDAFFVLTAMFAVMAKIVLFL